MNEFFYEPTVKVLMLKGEKGKGIVGIEKTGTSGFIDTYTVKFDDGTVSTFTVTNGKEISDISKTGTSGLVDTYTISFNDGTAGQYLKKKTATDYDFEWANIGCPFPVGYGGFFQIDPNTIYAGATWEQKKDVFILAAGETYPAGSTGGEAEHTLTEAEIAKHYHNGLHWGGPYMPQFGVNNYGEHGAGTKGTYKFEYSLVDSEAGFSTGESGGSQPHNNMLPYFAMPFWIRTA